MSSSESPPVFLGSYLSFFYLFGLSSSYASSYTFSSNLAFKVYSIIFMSLLLLCLVSVIFYLNVFLVLDLFTGVGSSLHEGRYSLSSFFVKSVLLATVLLLLKVVLGVLVLILLSTLFFSLLSVN